MSPVYSDRINNEIPLKDSDRPSTSDVMEAPLTFADQARGLRLLHIFSFVNSLAFLPFLGALTSMFFLEFGAKDYQIGLQRSLVFIAIPLGLLGAMIAERVDKRFLMGTAWVLRSSFVSAIILVPWIASRNISHASEWAVWVGITAVSLFTITRAIGSVAYLPILRGLAPGNMATRKQASMQMMSSLSRFAFIVFMVWMFWKTEKIRDFQTIYTIGVAAGLIGGSLFFFLPKPIIIKRPTVADSYRAAWDRLRRKPVQVFFFYQSLMIACMVAMGAFHVVFLRSVINIPLKFVLMFTLSSVTGRFFTMRGLKQEKQTKVRRMWISNSFWGLVTATCVFGVGWAGATGHIAAMVVLSQLFFLFSGVVSANNLVRGNSLMLQIAPDSAPTTFLTFYSISKSLGGLLGGMGVGMILDRFTSPEGVRTPGPFLVLFAAIGVIMALMLAVNYFFSLPENLYPRKRKPTGLHVRQPVDS